MVDKNDEGEPDGQEPVNSIVDYDTDLDLKGKKIFFFKDNSGMVKKKIITVLLVTKHLAL